MVPAERIALTRATKDMGFTDPPAYFNGLRWVIWWRLWESNPPVFLGASEVTTSCSPNPQINGGLLQIRTETL